MRHDEEETWFERMGKRFNGLISSDLPAVRETPKTFENSNQNYRDNRDKTVAVATDLFWLPMEDAPLGRKLHVLNLGGVATHAVITESTRKDWKGWQRIPAEPDWMKQKQR